MTVYLVQRNTKNKVVASKNLHLAFSVTVKTSGLLKLGPSSFICRKNIKILINIVNNYKHSDNVEVGDYTHQI